MLKFTKLSFGDLHLWDVEELPRGTKFASTNLTPNDMISWCASWLFFKIFNQRDIEELCYWWQLMAAWWCQMTNRLMLKFTSFGISHRRIVENCGIDHFGIFDQRIVENCDSDHRLWQHSVAKWHDILTLKLRPSKWDVWTNCKITYDNRQLPNEAIFCWWSWKIRIFGLITFSSRRKSCMS